MEGIEDATEAGYNVVFCMSKESAEQEKNALNNIKNIKCEDFLKII